MYRRFYLLVLLVLGTLGTKAQEVITDTTKLSYKPIFVAIEYYRVNYTYQSVAPDGETPITLSAAMVFPKKVFEHTSGITIGDQGYDASGLMLVSHHTITTRDEAPTQTNSMQIEGPLATIGPSMITISPDGYGFGITDDKPQAYLMADVTARNNLDAVRAARRLLEQMGYSYGELFVQLGYSQGGHSAMAMQRYVDTRGFDPEAISHIDYTLCGGGPYDITAMLDTLMLPGARYSYPCALPLIIHGQIAGAKLDVNYSDLFREPLDTKVIEWLDAKTYSTDDLNDMIYELVGGDSSTGVLVDDMLCTENFSRTDEHTQLLYQAIEENSLVSGWTPNDKTRFYLYHSKADEIVPHFCMEHLTDYLRNECGVGSDRLEVYHATGTHTKSAVTFVINCISKLGNMEKDYLAGKYIPTSINTPFAQNAQPSTQSRGWFNLQGQRLPERPSAAGLYIYDGHKVMIGRSK